MFKKNYDEKSDVWAMGVLMYILITGKPPIITTDESRFGEKIINREVNIISLQKAKKSKELVDFILICLEKDLDKRPRMKDLINHKWFNSLKKNRSVEMDFKKSVLTQSKKNLEEIKLETMVKAKKSRKIVLHKNKFMKSLKKSFFRKFLTFEDKVILDKDFKNIDENYDGVLTMKEFIRICKGVNKEDLYFYYSDDLTTEMQYSDFIFFFADEKFMKDKNKIRDFYYLCYNDSEFIHQKDIENVLGLGNKNKYLSKLFNKFSKKSDCLKEKAFVEMVKSALNLS